jgi:hypothetical protein
VRLDDDRGDHAVEVGALPVPLLVLIGGAPGSGKSTLGRLVSDTLQIPHVNADLVRRGINYTFGHMVSDPGNWPAFYETVSNLPRRRVSVVMDMTMRRGISEHDITTELLELCTPRYLHCFTAAAFERFSARERPRVDDREYRRLIEAFEEAVPLSLDPLELGVPMLAIDTSDGYAPPIAEILAFLRE